MKRRIGLLFLILPALAQADFNSDSRGTTTANFLKLGVGARAEAMGGAYAAVADDATALYWNPAGLARVDSHSAAVMHAPYLASTYYDYGAYAQRWGNHALGAGVQYFSAGSVNQTDINNTSLGSFSPYDLAASVGYAFRLTEAGDAIGMEAKFIQSKLLTTASAVAADFGIQSRRFGDRLRLGAAVANLGGKMKFEEESESLPLAMRFGAALNVNERWLASFDLVTPKDNAPYAAMGTEYKWAVRGDTILAGRLGYQSLTAGDISGVTGISFGFGLGWPRLSFDYAFLPYGGVGSTHRISLNFKWGDQREEERIQKHNLRDTQKDSSYSYDDLEKMLR